MKTSFAFTHMETKYAPVLVVGGGLVGLSAAMFLAWRRVPTVLVERHAGSLTASMCHGIYDPARWSSTDPWVSVRIFRKYRLVSAAHDG